MCLQPIERTYVNYRGFKRSVTVPCGKCIVCLRKKQNEWFLRFLEESKIHKHAYFVTYKFDNEHLSTTTLASLMEDRAAEAMAIYMRKRLSARNNRNILYNRYHPTEFNEYLDPKRFGINSKIPIFAHEVLQKHIKRIRIRYERLYKKKLDFKYFFQGEFGPNTFRPHYHGIVFTDVPIHVLKPLMVEDWKSCAGNDSGDYFEECNSRGAVSRYVSKYVAKPDEMENPYVVAGLIPKASRLISKGIGKCYIDKIATPENIAFVRGRARTPVTTHFDRYLGRSYQDLLDISKLFTYYCYDPSKKISYGYSIPRYWKNSLLPKRTDVRTVYEYRDPSRITRRLTAKQVSDGHPFIVVPIVRKTLVVDSESAFAKSWYRYVLYCQHCGDSSVIEKARRENYSTKELVSALNAKINDTLLQQYRTAYNQFTSDFWRTYASAD